MLQTSTDGKSVEFAHAAGGDVLEEAKVFCAAHVPQLDSETCVETLVGGGSKRYVRTVPCHCEHRSLCHHCHH